MLLVYEALSILVYAALSADAEAGCRRDKREAKEGEKAQVLLFASVFVLVYQ